MSMLLGFLLGLFVTLIAFPETAIGRTLHRALVLPVARRLNRIRPGHVLFLALLTAVAAALFLLFEVEGLRLFGFLAPEAVAWFGMFDAALFFDVFIVATSLAAATRLKAVRDQIVIRLRSIMAAVRIVGQSRPRSRRNRPTLTRPTRSDDPDPFGEVYAFG